MRLQWKNVPIPEAHLTGILLGAGLHRTYPKRLFRMGSLRHLLGWPLILLGGALSLWAVLEAGETDISSSKVLLTKGPYARSRNPMYAAWTLGYAGISFLSNAFWLIVLLPLVVAYTHLVDVQREEEFLEREFGELYLRYKRRVPRYL